MLESFFHLSPNSSWSNIISSCYEAHNYTDQTAEGHHHLVNNGHYDYETHKVRKIHIDCDLVIPSGFTLPLQKYKTPQFLHAYKLTITLTPTFTKQHHLINDFAIQNICAKMFRQNTKTRPLLVKRISM